MPWYSFCDGVNCGWLSADTANEVRKVELDWVHHHGCAFNVNFPECLERTGVEPIRLLRIDTNSGDGEKENYRTCLVVHEKRW